jgi:hypothetical protein
MRRYNDTEIARLRETYPALYANKSADWIDADHARVADEAAAKMRGDANVRADDDKSGGFFIAPGESVQDARRRHVRALAADVDVPRIDTVDLRLDSMLTELQSLQGARFNAALYAGRSEAYVRGALEGARTSARLDAEANPRITDRARTLVALDLADRELLGACVRRREELRLNAGVVRKDSPLTPREAMIERNSRLMPIESLALDARGEFILPVNTPARVGDVRNDGRSPRERFLEAQRTRFQSFPRTDGDEPRVGTR